MSPNNRVSGLSSLQFGRIHGYHEHALPVLAPFMSGVLAMSHTPAEGAATSHLEANTQASDSKGIAPRKIVTPVALFVAAVVFAIIALELYPSTAQLPTPPYATLGVTSVAGPVGIIRYLVTQVSPTRAEMLVTVKMPVDTKVPAPGAVDVLAAPPIGTRFTTCPAPNCKFAPSTDVTSWAKPLIFSMKSDGFGQPVPTAETGFLVDASGFGVTHNSTTASAAIPQVLYEGGGGSPTLLTQYNIPGASSYDWSSFPTEFANSRFATWSELVTSGDVGGRAAVGINHANQSSESDDTFIAGALIGLAGGALLSGFQEAMHARD
jgi:hypothetical protein